MWNRFTGPGRVGLQSMYLHMPTTELDGCRFMPIRNLAANEREERESGEVILREVKESALLV